MVLGAIAARPASLHGMLFSDDTRALQEAIAKLGVAMNVRDGVLHIGGGATPADDEFSNGIELHLGLGGAPARFCLALATLARCPVTIDGDERLRQRPMQDAIDLMQQLGIRVEAIGKGPGLPLRVTPGPWSSHAIDVGATATSQVVSALLLVSTCVGGLTVNFTQPPTSGAYLELTVDELRRWGATVEVQRDGDVLTQIKVSAGQPLGGPMSIAPDASSAVAAACMTCVVPQAEVVLSGVTLDDPQPDTRALRLLQRWGLTMEACDEGLALRSPGASDVLQTDDVVDASDMPDAVPVLAACVACRGRGPVRFRGLETLRVKESDRIVRTSELLQAAGGTPTQAIIEGDELVVHPLGPPSTTMEAIEMQTFDDHRMAMAGAVVGLWRGGVHIADPAVVAKSWPTFWQDCAVLGGWSA
jgi:3-phosphoshikimate 1-carboxyvinyltransferase